MSKQIGGATVSAGENDKDIFGHCMVETIL